MTTSTDIDWSSLAVATAMTVTEPAHLISVHGALTDLAAQAAGSCLAEHILDAAAEIKNLHTDWLLCLTPQEHDAARTAWGRFVLAVAEGPSQSRYTWLRVTSQSIAHLRMMLNQRLADARRHPRCP